MKTVCNKHSTLKAAFSEAATLSNRESMACEEGEEPILNVIESAGFFYVDNLGLVRGHETLHATFQDGKKVRL